jgi:hypothetical protein
VVSLGQRLRRFADSITAAEGEEHGERVRHWFEDKKAGWYAVLEDPQMPAMSTLLDQAHNAIDRKLFMMKGFHHPGGGPVWPHGGHPRRVVKTTGRTLMAVLSLRLPESLHRRVREMAKQEGISMNQFVALDLAEKVSALDTIDYLRQRAARADVTDFDRVLDMVPDIEPDAHDRLPSQDG